MSRQRRGLKLIGVPVEPDIHQAITDLAEEFKDPTTGKPMPLAAVARDLIRKALEKGWDRLVARDLKDAGYQEGLRRGLARVHAERKKLADALDKEW